MNKDLLQAADRGIDRREREGEGERKAGSPSGQAKFVLQLIDPVILRRLLFDCFQLAARWATEREISKGRLREGKRREAGECE